MHGEGTQPNILEKAEIREADALVACTTHDQDNILIGLMAKEAEISNIVIRVDDVQFTEVAKKLGLAHIINPSHIASTFIY
ncbi:MAG: NAD-binding protein [Methanohalobium sp.]|uniref:NAD-binding protein n=1 Tax=Methanohalobium sp. TaxID=2837493 RepID=UPI00397A2854